MRSVPSGPCVTTRTTSLAMVLSGLVARYTDRLERCIDEAPAKSPRIFRALAHGRQAARPAHESPRAARGRRSRRDRCHALPQAPMVRAVADETPEVSRPLHAVCSIRAAKVEQARLALRRPLWQYSRPEHCAPADRAASHDPARTRSATI